MQERLLLNKNEGHFVEMLPGVRRRTLTFSKQTLSAEFVLDEGAIIPSHSHVYEQTGYLLSGTVIFSIGGIKKTLSLGDAWTIPGGVEHSLEVLENSKIIEVFSPLREDYI